MCSVIFIAMHSQGAASSRSCKYQSIQLPAADSMHDISLFQESGSHFPHALSMADQCLPADTGFPVLSIYIHQVYDMEEPQLSLRYQVFI